MKFKNSPQPLELRPFKVKNPKSGFFCPLCRTQRALKYSAKLSAKQYLQIFLTGAVLFGLTHSFMEERAFIWLFIVWAVVECTNKLLFRKEVACPHCGFDATWYKRDVRVARKLVKNFWDGQELNNDDSDAEINEPETKFSRKNKPYTETEDFPQEFQVKPEELGEAHINLDNPY